MFANNPPLREMTHYGSRPPASCKECRRLKLKCDKKVPCSSCVRRGCASICPNGQMVAKGTRFVLANTEELTILVSSHEDGILQTECFTACPSSGHHEKIDTLISRVHSLEGALETSHALQSTEPHPLLRDELRTIATPIGSTTKSSEPVNAEEELADAVYTLTLDGRGSRYFGPTGAFASLWNDGDGRSGPDDAGSKHKGDLSLVLAGLPLEIAHMAHAFPIRIPTNENVSHLGAWILENCLPTYNEAWSLFENYWEHYAWHSTPFTRTSFVEEILSPLYHRTQDTGNKPLGHRLALLFMVFAIGQFMDFTQPLDAFSGRRYYMLARASLCLEPVFENPTLTALQAMYLLGIYLVMCRGAYVPEHAWILSGINTKLALTLGLHHDANKFDLPPAEVAARRQIMVSLLCFELWQSITMGRQPSYTFSHFEWLLSKTPDLSVSSPMISPSWAPYYIRDCVGLIMESIKETRYSVILKTDAKIRDYPIPNYAVASNEDSNEPPGVGLLMQQTAAGVLKEISMLFLHRRFFALSLARSPNDPLKSPFAPSVLACYRSSVAFLAKIRSLHAISPDMVQRVWFIWPNVFVATLILGSIVARSPGCSLAPSAVLELELVCQLWNTTSDNVCGPKVLETVNKLKDKAFMVFSQSKASRDPFHWPSSGVEVDDEIAALGGAGPRVISSPQAQGSSTHSPSQTNISISNTEATSQLSTPSPSRDVLDGFSYPVTQPFEYTNVGFAAQFPDLTAASFSTDFDDIFQNMATSVPTQQASAIGPSVLEELGLSGGWQPVMDDLGL